MTRTIRTTTDIDELVNAMMRAKGTADNGSAWGGITFLIGAGCSVSAGIPAGEGVAKICAVKLAETYGWRDAADHRAGDPRSEAALAWLKDQKKVPGDVEWARAYGHIFDHHYKDPNHQRGIISEIVGRGNGSINWAHLCLGELMRTRYVHTVLTTNFDQLVLDGAVRAGLLPVVADGIESLSRVDSRPPLPQVVHLHGSMHTYDPRNSTEAVGETERDVLATQALTGLLRDSSTFVVVGYAGGEEGIMRLLHSAMGRLGNKEVYWVQYANSTEPRSERARELLALSGNARLMPGWDADHFFYDLMQGLGLGVPEWMRDPIRVLKTRAGAFAASDNDDIKAEFAAYECTLDDLAAQATSGSAMTAQAVVTRARRERMAGDGAKADKALDAADAEVRKSADYWMERGRVAFYEARSTGDVAPMVRAADAFSEMLHRLDKKTDKKRRADALFWRGSALLELGRREVGTERLKEAASVLHQAEKARDRAGDPHSWAATQNNLGSALWHLGRREAGTARLLEAASAYERALKVLDRVADPANWATTQINLGTALMELGRREAGTERLEQAVDLLNKALEDPGMDQTNWAWGQRHLARAQALLGERREDAELLREALEGADRALAVGNGELGIELPFRQATKGIAMAKLAVLCVDRDNLRQAVDILKDAADTFEVNGFFHDAKETGAERAAAEASLATLTPEE